LNDDVKLGKDDSFGMLLLKVWLYCSFARSTGAFASEGNALVFPDTSPRGAVIEGEDEDWVSALLLLFVEEELCTYARSF